MWSIPRSFLHSVEKIKILFTATHQLSQHTTRTTKIPCSYRRPRPAAAPPHNQSCMLIPPQDYLFRATNVESPCLYQGPFSIRLIDSITILSTTNTPYLVKSRPDAYNYIRTPQRKRARAEKALVKIVADQICAHFRRYLEVMFAPYAVGATSLLPRKVN